MTEDKDLKKEEKELGGSNDSSSSSVDMDDYGLFEADDVEIDKGEGEEIDNEEDVIDGEEDVIDGEVVSEGEESEMMDIKESHWESFKRQAQEILREADVSLSQVAIWAGCGFLALIIIVVLIFSGRSIFDKAFDLFSGNDSSKVKVKRENDEPEWVDYSLNSYKSGLLIGGIDGNSLDRKINLYAGVEAGYFLGTLEEDVARNLSSKDIKSGILVGGGILSFSTNTEVERLIMQLRIMASSQDEEVLLHLDQLELEDEREFYLDEQIEDMNDVLDESRRLYSELSERVDILKSEYESLEQLKAYHEVDFFDHVEVLSPSVSNESLEAFVELASEQVAALARYRALNKIKELFVPSFRKLKSRLTYMELNKEALIKGIKVVEVEGSDIDVVIKPKVEGK